MNFLLYKGGDAKDGIRYMILSKHYIIHIFTV
jgi:hypothetical protein